MNSKYLGDAFDHWKGSTIQRLEAKKLLRNIAVDPMITDSEPWNDKKLGAYSELLGLNVNRICNGGGVFWRNNRSYFDSSIGHSGDLFLDPDTGVATAKPKRKNVTWEEIKALLGYSQNGNRVVMVYQHASHSSSQKRLEEIIRYISDRIENLHSTTYDCGAVAMLFFSYDRGRMERIQKYLKTMLRGDGLYSERNVPKQRVRMWS